MSPFDLTSTKYFLNDTVTRCKSSIVLLKLTFLKVWLVLLRKIQNLWRSGIQDPSAPSVVGAHSLMDAQMKCQRVKRLQPESGLNFMKDLKLEIPLFSYFRDDMRQTHTHTHVKTLTTEDDPLCITTTRECPVSFFFLFFECFIISAPWLFLQFVCMLVSCQTFVRLNEMSVGWWPAWWMHRYVLLSNDR